MLSLQGKQRMPSNSPNPVDALFTFGLGSRAMWITQRQQGHFYQLVEKHVLPHQHKFCMLLLAIVFNGIFIMFYHAENREHGSYQGDGGKRDANQRISATQSGAGGGRAGREKKWNHENKSSPPRENARLAQRPGHTDTDAHLLLFLFFKLQEKCWNRIWTWPWGNWALILTEHFPKPINAELPFWSNHKADRRGVRVWSDLLWVVPGVQM